MAPSQALGTGGHRALLSLLHPALALLPSASSPRLPADIQASAFEGGLTLTDAAGMARPVPEARVASKCQQHLAVTPSSVGGGPPGTEMLRTETRVQLPWPLWCCRHGRAPFLGGCPRTYAKSLRPSCPHPPSPAVPYCRCAGHSPTSLATCHPGGHPGLGGSPSQPATPCASRTPRRWESCPKAVPSRERASSFPACSPKTSPTFLLN